MTKGWGKIFVITSAFVLLAVEFFLPGAANAQKLSEYKIQGSDPGKYMTFKIPGGYFGGNYEDAHLTYVVSGNKADSAKLYFSWDHLIPAANRAYRVDYRTVLAGDKMTPSDCLQDKSVTSSWKPIASTFRVPIAGASNKVIHEVLDGRRKYTGDAFFRVIANPGASDEVVLACSMGTLPALTTATNGVNLSLTTIDATSKEKLVSKIFLTNGKAINEYVQASGTKPTGTTTPMDIEVLKGPNFDVSFVATGYDTLKTTLNTTASKKITLGMCKTGSTGCTAGIVSQEDPDLGGGVASTKPGDSSDPNNCNTYLGIPNPAQFNIGKYIACQMINGYQSLVYGINKVVFGIVPTNPWVSIVGADGKASNGVVTTWKVVLSLIDFIVIGGLVVSAFANIFKFLPIKLDSYEVKAALPGIIWGIILANISFFAMNLFIEFASIITQGFGPLVSSYVNVAFNDASTPAYIISNFWRELMKSLLLTPTDWFPGWTAPDFGSFGQGSEVVLHNLMDSNAPLIGLILFVVFGFVVTIMFAILVFLLFIRNYIIVVLFMISPLAFFSLGFPPLKSIWTKWWGTFWKWLLMLPVTFAIMAFALIFLASHNVAGQAAADAGAEGRSLLDYFFFNGVAVAMIYFAWKIPFMWGQFFGYNAMQNWAKLGSKGAQLAHSGAKVGYDKLGEKRVLRRFHAGLNTAAIAGGNASEIKTMNKRAEKLERAGLIGPQAGLAPSVVAGNVNAAMAAMTRQQRQQMFYDDIAKDQGAAKRGNIFRMPEAAVAGWKEQLSTRKSEEEKEIKKNNAFGKAGGKPVRQKGWFSRYGDEAKDFNDPKEVMTEFAPTADKLIATGIIDPPALRKLLAKGETGLKAEINNPDSPLARAMAVAAGGPISDEDAIKMHRYGYRAQQLLLTRDYPGLDYPDPTVLTGARPGFRRPRNGAEILEAMMTEDPATGAPYIPRPYGDYDLDGNPITPQSSNDEEVNQAINAAGKDAIAATAIETIRNLPHAAVRASQEAFRKSEEALQESLRQQGVAKPQAQAIINSLFRNVHQGIAGVPFSQLLQAAGASADATNTEPFVRAFSEKAKALNRTALIAAEKVAEDIPVKFQVASNIAKSGVAPEVMQSQIDDVKRKLATGAGTIEDLHKQVAGFAGKLSIASAGAGPDELRGQTQQTIKEIESALNVLSHPEFKAARSMGDPAQYAGAIESIKSQTVLAQHAAVQTAQDIDAQRSKGVDLATLTSNPEFMKSVTDRVRTALVESSPTAREQYHSSDNKKQAVDQAVAAEAEKLVSQFQGAIASGAKSAHSSIRDRENGPEEIRNDLIKNIAEKVFGSTQTNSGSE